MNTKDKSTFVPQSNQPTNGRDSVEREKTPTLHIQTGVRAGGFYDWWAGVAEGFNAADRANQGV